MPIEAKARPEVSQDMQNLASDDLRREALQYMVALRTKPKLGKKLDKHVATGDLSDCWKVFFDNANHRIVYRLLPDEKKPTLIDIIVVGPRHNMDVYKEAVRRLGR